MFAQVSSRKKNMYSCNFVGVIYTWYIRVFWTLTYERYHQNLNYTTHIMLLHFSTQTPEAIAEKIEK